MKCMGKFLLVLSMVTVVGTVVILMNEWRKNSRVWRSLKQAALERELINFKNWAQYI